MGDHQITHAHDSALRARFSVLTRELPYSVEATWPSEASLPEEAIAGIVESDGDTRYILGCPRDGFVLVNCQRGNVYAEACGQTPDAAQTLIALVRELQPVAEHEDGMVPVTFWAYGPNGPFNTHRKVTAPAWEEIADNYAITTLKRLAPLTDGSFAPGIGGQLLLWSGNAGTGKALALDTPLPTPDGWTTMGAVRPGDVLFDETGSPCVVEGVSDVMHGHDTFEVCFSDGSTIVADGEHLWATLSGYQRSPGRPARRSLPRGVYKTPSGYIAQAAGTHFGSFDTPQAAGAAACQGRRTLGLPEYHDGRPGILTTQQIAASLYQRGRLRHAVSVADALTTPDVDLPIDPYTLGAWLGDGASAGARIYTADSEIVERCGHAGYDVNKGADKYGWNIRGLRAQLRRAGLLHNKHIPGCYGRASQAQRRALLAGLMDTDGSAARGSRCEFYSTRRELIDGVYELVVSLGYRAQIIEGRAVLDGHDHGPKWIVGFCTHDQSPFWLERKRASWRPATARARRRYICAVRPVDSVPVKCVRVSSPSKLYLAGRSMIPTHNTTLLRALAREWEDWCELHYITDPEKFFGTQADYMIQVLLGGDTKRTGSEPPWRLLVLEDAGELLRADAGEVTGKALSRMLNTVDGLIGQGLRVLVLVTTNEEVGKLHPAVARPGRCAVEVEFEPLDQDEAAIWREAHGLPRKSGSATLAELYAELEGFNGARQRQPVGFATA